jgi:hypothetical protein
MIYRGNTLKNTLRNSFWKNSNFSLKKWNEDAFYYVQILDHYASYKLLVDKFWFQIVKIPNVRSLILEFEFQYFWVTPDIDISYNKVLDLNKIYNLVLYNFLIWCHL